MNRLVTLQGSFSDADVRFRSLSGTEALSSLYEFEVEVLSPNYGLDIKETLGKKLSLEIKQAEGGTRRLGGQVTRMELVGREGGTSRDYAYRLTLRPWLWYLTRTSDCKVFQQKTVVDIIDEVLKSYGYPVEKRLSAAYRQWEYCVQYQETDFAFISRLMEQEGIYYYFEHGEAGETLVLADQIGAHKPLPVQSKLSYLPPDRLVKTSDLGVDQWRPREEVRPGAFMVGDYDFQKPKADMRSLLSNPAQHENDKFEMFEWLGGFIDQAHSESYARVRLEEFQTLRECAHAHTQLRSIAPGHTFSLTDHPRSTENRDYLIVSADYAFREGGYATGADESRYETEFVVQPTTLPYRAPRITPMPYTRGPQTAVVVGPKGEEIWTDQYGRVKVQFRWDRYGKMDENSSCWVRVSSSWSGSNFGGMHIPRVSEEVVVDFINGIPDRPLIVGRVYNADKMPPFALPESRTQSGIVTRSFEQGTVEHANMLRFDDKRGAEQIKVHAERDLDTSVEHDETHVVNQHRTKHVQGNERTTIGGNQSRAVTGHINTSALQGISMETPQAVNMTAASAINQLTTNFTEFIQNLVSTKLASISLTGMSSSMTGASFGVTGSSVSGTGSSVSGTGSSVSATGSSIGNTGSSISTTGSSMSTTGSSVSYTGVSVSKVGYSVKN